jgi:DNA-binding LacI/PurR family transcriptional regulator
VPRDVSVIGFDGAGVDAHFSPRLTTVQVPLEEIGAIGTRMLLQKIGGESVKEKVVLPTQLRVGASSAAPGILPARRARNEK